MGDHIGGHDEGVVLDEVVLVALLEVARLAAGPVEDVHLVRELEHAVGAAAEVEIGVDGVGGQEAFGFGLVDHWGGCHAVGVVEFGDELAGLVQGVDVVVHEESALGGDERGGEGPAEEGVGEAIKLHEFQIWHTLRCSAHGRLEGVGGVCERAMVRVNNADVFWDNGRVGNLLRSL